MAIRTALAAISWTGMQIVVSEGTVNAEIGEVVEADHG